MSRFARRGNREFSHEASHGFSEAARRCLRRARLTPAEPLRAAPQDSLHVESGGTRRESAPPRLGEATRWLPRPRAAPAVATAVRPGTAVRLAPIALLPAVESAVAARERPQLEPRCEPRVYARRKRLTPSAPGKTRPRRPTPSSRSRLSSSARSPSITARKRRSSSRRPITMPRSGSPPRSCATV